MKLQLIAKRGTWLALLSLFLLTAQGLADSTQDRILKGNEYARKKDFKKALMEYEAAVKLSPSDPRANLLLGLAYANVGELKKAAQFSEASVKLEPSYSGFHNLGLVYANQEDYPKAVDAYEKALNLNPTAYRTWYQLGLIQAASGNFKTAIDAYQKSILNNSQFAEAYLGLGTAYYWSGEKLQALEQANELRLIRQKEKAAVLEQWIQEKDEQKKKKTQPAASP
jgi:tetratricopeptide (TPR) repeat protein